MARKKQNTYQAATAQQASLPLVLHADDYLTIGALETWLWDAACVIRGAADPPSIKILLCRWSSINGSPMLLMTSAVQDENVSV